MSDITDKYTTRTLCGQKFVDNRALHPYVLGECLISDLVSYAVIINSTLLGRSTTRLRLALLSFNKIH